MSSLSNQCIVFLDPYQTRPTVFGDEGPLSTLAPSLESETLRLETKYFTCDVPIKFCGSVAEYTRLRSVGAVCLLVNTLDCLDDLWNAVTTDAPIQIVFDCVSFNENLLEICISRGFEYVSLFDKEDDEQEYFNSNAKLPAGATRSAARLLHSLACHKWIEPIEHDLNTIPIAGTDEETSDVSEDSSDSRSDSCSVEDLTAFSQLLDQAKLTRDNAIVGAVDDATRRQRAESLLLRMFRDV